MNGNRLIYGTREFTGNDIKSGNLYQARSLLSTQLEADTITAEVRCKDPSILLTGENARMTYFHSGQQAGVFYAQSIERTGPELYKISGVSGMGVLSQMAHPGGIYTGQTAEAIVREIAGPVQFVIKESLRTVKLYGWLPYAKPPEKSARDNLVQVLFALGATVKTDFDGVLRIVPLWNGVSGRIEKGRMYQGGSVEYEKTPATSAAVTEHQYMTGGDETRLFEGDAVSGDVITFSEPMYGLSATGFRILESGANYAKLSAGNGVLTGRKYIHTTRQIVETLRAGAENVKTVSDGTLVSLVNARAVAQRMADYYKCAERVRTSIVAGTERPGDVVSIYHPYDRTFVSACVESADIAMSGVLKSSITALVGYTPKQIEQTVTYDRHQVITSSRTVTLPDGVTRVRAVLIGGGTGGKGGKKGSSGTAGMSCTTVRDGKMVFGSPGVGGEGGDGGPGGGGGKIASFEITGTAIKTLTVSIGGGGSGGSANEGTGSAGGNTTLTVNGTAYSSATGAASSAGYQDLVTGTVYAGTGTAGRAGARGGDGGMTGESTSAPAKIGNAGENAGGNAGGKGGNPSSRYYPNDYGAIGSSGGGGGGAAYNAAGNSGSASTGGTGAAGTKPAAATVPGSGGSGGNGGGGGGGGGGSWALVSHGQTGSLSSPGGAAGQGGDGGPGGSGAPGCVILYYGVPQKMKAGSPVDKNQKFYLDRFGRLLVV